MPQSDGSLVFDTKIDNKGFEKDANALSGKASNILSNVTKAVTAGLAASSAAIIKIGKDAIKSYADYEQLVGGVDTLFKDASGNIQQYAAQAFKTAGLSANAYMETVTSFSASLIKSVGGNTQTAAEYANQAITDMSDNANKMGSSMESIQNAYQGFAKQNYTMLDNLKLGYGGTKEEMQRLLKDAEKLTGKKFDLSNFGDITQAIHAIQTEMGITGTTAKEASSTIQGSFGMLKASWENLMTGLTDPKQNLDKLIDDVFTSLKTFGANLLPRVKQVLGGISKVILELAPPLISAITSLIPELMPAVVDGVIAIGSAIVNTIPALIPQLIEGGKTIFNAIFSGLQENLSNLGFVITDVVTTILAFEVALKAVAAAQAILNAVTLANPYLLLGAAIAALIATMAIWTATNDGLKTQSDELIQKANEQIDIINQQAEAYDKLKQSKQQQAEADLANLMYTENLSGELMTLADVHGKVAETDKARVSFILNELNGALGTEYQLVGNVIQNYTQLKQSILDAIEAQKAEVILASEKEVWAEAIKTQAEQTKNAESALVSLAEAQSNYDSVVRELTKAQKELNSTSDDEMAKKLELGEAISSLTAERDKAKEAVDKYGKAYSDANTEVSKATSDMSKYETDYALITQGKCQEVVDSYAGVGAASDAANQKVAKSRADAEKNFTEAFVKLAYFNKQHTGVLSEHDKEVQKQLEESAIAAKAQVTKYGGYIVDGTIAGIGGKSGNLKGVVKNLFNSIPEWARKLLNIHSPSKVMSDEVGKYIPLGVAKGIKDNAEAPTKAFKAMLEKLDYQKKFGVISEDEYYTQLEKLRDTYLTAGTKEWLEYTEKIYDYQQNLLEEEKKLLEEEKKNVEKEKKDIESLYADISSYAIKKLEDVGKKQASFAKKLTDAASIISKTNVKLGDESFTTYSLTDFTKDIDNIKNYKKAMEDATTALKATGASDDVIAAIREKADSLSIDDGIIYFNTLTSANPDELKKAVSGYGDLLNSASSTATSRYADNEKQAVDESYQYMVKKLTDAGFEIPEQFAVSGSISAQKFGEEFIAELNSQMAEIQSRIADFNAKLQIELNNSDKANGITNNDNRTTTYYISQMDTSDTTEKIRNYETVKRLSGN